MSRDEQGFGRFAEPPKQPTYKYSFDVVPDPRDLSSQVKENP
jgi:hypothetical protein